MLLLRPTTDCFVAYDDDGAAGGGIVNGTNTTATNTGGRKVLCHGDFTGLYVDGGADTVFRYAVFPDQTLATDLARRAAGDRSRMAAAWEASGRPGETVRAAAQCARDRTEPECLRCLQASARQAAASCGGDWSGWVQGGQVLTYGCYLRFAVSSVPATGGAFILRWAVAALHHISMAS